MDPINFSPHPFQKAVQKNIHMEIEVGLELQPLLILIQTSPREQKLYA